MHPKVVEIMRSKTPAERIKLASDMNTSMRKMMASQMRADHPEWCELRIAAEILRRLWRRAERDRPPPHDFDAIDETIRQAYPTVNFDN